MPSEAKSKYFDATANRTIRDDLLFAVERVGEPKIAIDCGCGAGADIGFLISQGFVVHGFDVEEESISRCIARFKDVSGLTLSRSSFSAFNYPKASLLVADASLFFCPRSEFEGVWTKIFECLYPNGVFCGSFLGTEDTMAGPLYNPGDYWPEVTAFEEEEVRALFANFEILRFTVHKSSGVTPAGEPHDWHNFSVVAKKRGIKGAGSLNQTFYLPPVILEQQ
jgi:SAM-dependent methyltransferase